MVGIPYLTTGCDSKSISADQNNTIKSNYVDFSLDRNSLIISKNVVYSNQKNLLKADVLEIDIETKNTKIFMYEEEKKVKIKSLKNHGNN